MDEYISKEFMLKNLEADKMNNAEHCEPVTVKIMERFIRYVKEFPAADVQPVKLIQRIVQGRLNGANYTLFEAVKSNDTNTAYKMRGAIDICCEILADLRALTATDGEQNG